MGALFIASKLELDLPDADAGAFTGIAYLIYGITIGALVGGGIGAAMGHKDDYIINPLKE